MQEKAWQKELRQKFGFFSAKRAAFLYGSIYDKVYDGQSNDLLEVNAFINNLFAEPVIFFDPLDKTFPVKSYDMLAEGVCKEESDIVKNLRTETEVTVCDISSMAQMILAVCRSEFYSYTFVLSSKWFDVRALQKEENEAFLQILEAVLCAKQGHHLVFVSQTLNEWPEKLIQNSHPLIFKLEIPPVNLIDRQEIYRSLFPDAPEYEVASLADLSKELSMSEIRNIFNKLPAPSLDKMKVILNESQTQKEEVNLWDAVTEKKINELEAHLKSKIYGQDEAIAAMIEAVYGAKLGTKRIAEGKQSQPAWVLIFTGPPGTGKTMLCEETAKFLLGDDCFYRVDCGSSLSTAAGYASLIGAPYSYVGYGETIPFIASLTKNPRQIILFDEIEKADPDIIKRHLLGILDRGIITTGSGQDVSLSNCIIVFTSNIGVESDEVRQEKDNEAAKELIRKKFSEFFLNISAPFFSRIKGYSSCVFNRLSIKAAEDIIRSQLSSISAYYASKKNIKIIFMETFITAFLKELGREEWDARSLSGLRVRFVDRQITQVLKQNKSDGSITFWTIREDGTSLCSARSDVNDYRYVS